MSSVPFDLYQNSVLIHAQVNGQAAEFVLDTGDAVGPVFTQADADRLGLNATEAFQVSGAGGESTSYATVASITFDDRTFADEASAIDPDLQDYSLLGLPFFVRESVRLEFDFVTSTLTLDGR
jgi:predicted aspartyl protease